MDKISHDITIGDKKITLTFGQIAPQANGSVTARLGDTVVLATAVLGKLDTAKDYFPLSVDYVDKLFAGGQIKGGKWLKRDFGGSDNSILFGRIIDRSVRPLFPAGFKNEVQLAATVLSNDKDSDVITVAFIAASAALALSDIPFNSPVSAVRVGKVDGQLKLFPTLSELAKSDLDLFVCRDPEGINMIEAEANIVDNDTMLAAMEMAEAEGQKINAQIMEFAKKYGKKKIEFEDQSPDAKLLADIEKHLSKKDLPAFMADGADGAHSAGEDLLKDKLREIYKKELESEEVDEITLITGLDIVLRKFFRAEVLKGSRYDKRAFDEIRPLNVEVGVLPCTHGSAIFQRGLTQALTVTTLAPISEQQYLQDSFGEVTKRYIHYYNAPPFSTGQTGRIGRPGRREVGHGALAEKALKAVIPTLDEFPYMILVASEIMSQNGSTSMASTCGSTMSLMDAGVPIKDKVAGISVGMVSDDQGYKLLTDIGGIEDHCGDMDFKITGTRNGITAIQLDVKRPGLTLQMIRDTFTASTKARLAILDKMESVLSAPRPQLSKYAPKIKMITLPEDKIGEIIGSGGKNIKKLMEKYGVSIDIDDFGHASVSGLDPQKIDDCVFEIESAIREVHTGEEFDGTVTRVEAYGAFVEFLPGREALLHVSEMAMGFISDPSSIIKIGDKLKVKIAGFNDNFQIKLSAPEFKAAHQGQPRPAQSQNHVGFDRPRSGGFRNFPSGGGDRRPRR